MRVLTRCPPYWLLFDHLRAVADVILLDRRGVGISSLLIDCPAGMADHYGGDGRVVGSTIAAGHVHRAGGYARDD